MPNSPVGFDLQYVVSPPDERCRVWIGIDVFRGDVQRFLVQLQRRSAAERRTVVQIARIDHNPAGRDGHDLRTEGVHVDVVLRDGDEQTVYPPTNPGVQTDLGATIDQAKRYFRRHTGYFLRVHYGEIEPNDPPPWP
ncbi:hypothetical protein L593_09360 [Salinarchaeum sp. Harcht-Bsk1]|uniref:DUF7718 family protein n=1 Tax=Salinarchaeum sp. Harcht-Bsk1 TaxID=1333523 RepID=UPI0003422FC3|nr:hypothetical protein [Salinarchaeum sp. Harcht-Bsk1]AGN01817.1 hypothetical protein L593_09360 [Salinarchaeum sp. Harcht-Bsk1]